MAQRIDPKDVGDVFVLTISTSSIDSQRPHERIPNPLLLHSFYACHFNFNTGNCSSAPQVDIPQVDTTLK